MCHCCEGQSPAAISFFLEELGYFNDKKEEDNNEEIDNRSKKDNSKNKNETKNSSFIHA
jgi:hypothetical protein